MIAQCANPSCSARFKYLHSGRVFQFDTPRELPADGNRQLPCEPARFWLCSDCSSTMTLARGPQGVILVACRAARAECWRHNCPAPHRPESPGIHHCANSRLVSPTLNRKPYSKILIDTSVITFMIVTVPQDLVRKTAGTS